MNRTDEHIDSLTRSLMKDTAEQPSPSLNMRIMALILGEKRAAQSRCYMKKLPSAGTVLIIIVVYVLVLAGVAAFFMKQPEAGGSEWMQGVKHFFPLLLTVSSSISVFFFFSQLDGWLRMKERIKENLQEE